jgi:hypothetical protein
MKLSINWVSAALLVGFGIGGCADSANTKSEEATGTLLVPLVSYGSTGAKYQLRNANFQINPYYYYYGEAGSGSITPVVVSSESNVGADSLEVDVASGSYHVTLSSGWSMEKVENGVTTTVEAQLLSGSTQYLYVSPRSSTWVRYQFGIGEHSVWFNGKANIAMDVYEDPDQYYGVAGSGNTPGNIAGAPAYAGAPTNGGAVAVGY